MDIFGSRSLCDGECLFHNLSCLFTVDPEELISFSPRNISPWYFEHWRVFIFHTLSSLFTVRAEELICFLPRNRPPRPFEQWPLSKSYNVLSIHCPNRRTISHLTHDLASPQGVLGESDLVAYSLLDVAINSELIYLKTTSLHFLFFP